MNAENLGGISTCKVAKRNFFICFPTCSHYCSHIHTGVNRCQPHTWLILDPPGRLSRPTLILSHLSLVPSDAPEKISLDVLLKGPVIEGNNVTLKCHADGNPQPSRFYFHLKVSQTPTGICFGGKSSFRIQPVSHR